MHELELVGAVLRGDPDGAQALAGADPHAFVDVARRHGVLPLVAEALAGQRVSARLEQALASDAAGFVAADLARERALRQVIAALHTRGVSVIIFKGAALGYTHYPRPDLRPRDDSDLLIPPGAQQAAHDTLVALGYRPPAHVTGDLVSYQAIYQLVADGVVVHTVDLHWRVANPQLFADVLSFDQLAATAQPIQALGPAALGPSNVHALFIACVHRVAHHRDEKLLIWIYDIHVVASRLSPQEWDDFLRLAAAARVLGICRRGLELAVGEFRTPVPTRIWQDARWTPPAAEPSEAFLSRNRAQLATFVSDIRALPSWRARLRLVKEHLCPSPRYMRDVYAPASRAPLPMLYVHRAVRGAWRWLARD